MPEDVAAARVLPYGAFAVAGSGTGFYEETPEVLAQRIEGEPTGGGIDGRRVIASIEAEAGETRKGGKRIEVQAQTSVAEPLLERFGIVDPNAGEELPAVKGGGFGEETGSAGRGVAVCLGEKLPEAGSV